MKKGKYVPGENHKSEKNDDQTKQSLKKEMRIMGATEGETFKNENKKDKCSKTNENKSKREISKQRQTCKDKEM